HVAVAHHAEDRRSALRHESFGQPLEYLHKRKLTPASAHTTRRGDIHYLAVTRPVLDGVTVLELGQIYNVPYCTLLLAHLGAEVIKIEPPAGEPARHRAGGQDATPFVMLNSGKRGVCLNLKSTRGRELLLALAASADAVVEN